MLYDSFTVGNQVTAKDANLIRMSIYHRVCVSSYYRLRKLGAGQVTTLQDKCHSSGTTGRSQYPGGLRRRSTAARQVAIVGSNPTGGMAVCLL